MIRAKFVGCAIALCAFGVANADLVANGGFETGTFADWTFDNSGDTYIATADPNRVHSGNYGVAWGFVYSENHMSQVLATTSGDTYQLSFWYNILGGHPNELSAFINPDNSYSNAVFDVVNPPFGGWLNVKLNFTATSNATTLAFGMRQDPGYSGLDDISVNAVPEPFTMGLGLAGAGLFFRRRARAKKA